ncbi:C2H2-type zinc finger transcription factor [Phycomyces blakesleeanus NRRL 1555(-)]|uniref:C2H2-type zinc finger transcription factor n=1 Tax=Phycomyces blakesleeanus (strain ATCC 8743b / DSM 1359 / FGSC 10004 / NBRC 33097 / NRRL 1555) TaxID=763407 RepID=A0A162TA23_PHYB8|nr:C2H2-type zinc finger transcription factor [Phycomyces blakesleeanus NRRL 1555(-)]OAD65403.1 C2H2-type zinc finger transcription factor [Phycomyces blakesleeanus NRRL 1555(-)]|eukprot:XP_018283443.1 C2H2-type zinc finger transcription factor [Phycomyces blakesleeanus NRRL 1555(-)]
MQHIINYPKNSRVVVSAPKGPGQHNFALDNIGKPCSLCGKDFNCVWNLQCHLTKYHKLATHIANDISSQYANRNLVSQRQTMNTAELTAPDHNDDSVNKDLHVESDLEDDNSSNVDNMNSDGNNNVSEIELDASESIIEMDEDTSPFESPSSGNHLYMHIRNCMLSSASNTSSSLDADLDLLREATGLHTTWNQYTSDTHLFLDLQSMVLLAFVDGNNDMVSRRILKKILFTISLVLKLHKKAIQKKFPFKLPRLDALLNYQTRKKSKIPVFLFTKVDIQLPENKATSAYINLPSDHVRFLAANPKKARNMFSLPDCTPNQSICLQQDEKWRIHWYYQQPMFIHNGVDFWSGDIVNFMNGSTPACFLVESFHTMDNSAVFVQGYMVYILEGGQFIGIKVESTSIKFETLLSIDSTPVDVALCYNVSPGKVFHLIPRHKFLLEEAHFLKQHILDKTRKPIDPKLFYKVRILPIILFTNNTSGNQSKQYNLYESWSMKFAALSYEEKLL